MKITFNFIIQSLMLLLDNDFYLFPLILCSFVLLINIVKELRSL